jgi:acylphosphatase
MSEEYGAFKCVVEGRVQGVFYRAATADRAAALGIDGWVRNLADGGVEVVASGPREALESLAAWLWQGPPAASVTAVTLEEWQGEVEPGFRISF